MPLFIESLFLSYCYRIPRLQK